MARSARWTTLQSTETEIPLAWSVTVSIGASDSFVRTNRAVGCCARGACVSRCSAPEKSLARTGYFEEKPSLRKVGRYGARRPRAASGHGPTRREERQNVCGE